MGHRQKLCLTRLMSSYVTLALTSWWNGLTECRKDLPGPRGAYYYTYNFLFFFFFFWWWWWWRGHLGAPFGLNHRLFSAFSETGLGRK